MYSSPVLTYLSEATKARRAYRESCSVVELARSFPAWRRDLNECADPLVNEKPWLTFSAIRFLDKYVTSAMNVFEFGLGGSTLFWGSRVNTLVSVEHDPKWLERVTFAMQAKGWANWKVHLAEPKLVKSLDGSDPADPNEYVSSDDAYHGCSFREYATSIEAYPDRYFDIVLVDGRARPSCVKHAMSKVRDGGLLVLDNAERSHYATVLEAFSSDRWVKQQFYGPGPYVSHFWLTSIWQRQT
jgi:hypothetical protein